jgi:hypothetical protein
MASTGHAQQSTVQDVCAEGQMRDADGKCTPGTGMGGTGGTGDSSQAIRPAAKAGGAMGETGGNTMPNAEEAQPEATRFGAKVADPNAGGGTGQ